MKARRCLQFLCLIPLLLFPATVPSQTLQQSFIWSPSAAAGSQLYRAFRKTFTLATNPPTASLRIFADSRFILWVNSSYVLRGPCRFDWHRPEYDTIDIRSYLQPGSNVIAVLVHSYRGGGNSKIMEHVPGLAAQLALPGTNLFTDSSWRSGPTIYQASPAAWGSIPDVIDARAQTNDWTSATFNDASWETASTVSGDQWGTLFPRELPLAKETVLTNTALLPSAQKLGDAMPISLSAGQQILVDLGQMSLAYAALDLTASAGSVLQITYYLRLANGVPSETYGVGTTYTTRAGRQTFITGDEWGCHYVAVRCASGSLTLNGLSFVDRRYPYTRAGEFTSSDPIFNQLWTNAVNTIELATDDGYGADPRERNEWLQDPAQPNFITSRVADAGPSTNGGLQYSDPRLLKNLMRHIAWTTNQTGDGRLKAHSCSDRWDVHGYIEDYACQWIESLRLYHDATRDTNFVMEMWAPLTNQIAWFLTRLTTNGLVSAREYASFDNPLAYLTCEGATLNAFVFQALNDSAYLAGAIGAEAQAQSYRQAAARLATAFDLKLWNASAGSYHAALLNGQPLAPSTHAALLALDRGIVPADRIGSVRAWWLKNYRNPGTFNVGANSDYSTWLRQTVGINMPVSYYWVFQQLYAMDSPAMDQEVLNEIRRRWTDMVTNRLDTGTVTECFTDVNNGSESCHNYGAVPAWFLSSRVLGVGLDGPAWTNRLWIEPRLGDLRTARGIVVTEHGPVPVSWAQSDDYRLLSFSVTVPNQKHATLRLPKTSETNTLILNGTTVVSNGIPGTGVVLDGRWFSMDIPPGTATGTLTMIPPPPYIRGQPGGGVAFAGDSFTFSVSALGQSLAYQWQKDALDIPNATNNVLLLSHLQAADSGQYRARVINAGGASNSQTAALLVVPPATNMIYQDSFSGNAGALNTRVPDAVAAASNRWIAAGGWVTDGASARVTNSTINAFLPFTPSQGAVYLLSADINCQGSGSADWIALGFANGTNTTTAWHLANSPVGWLLARDSGITTADGQTFTGPGASGGASSGFYPTNLTSYSIQLDCRPQDPAAWSFAFAAGSNTLRTASFGGGGPNISSLGLGMLGQGGYGYVKNFSLKAISSPAPLIIRQPQSGTFTAGLDAQFSVSVAGSGPFTYQWMKDAAIMPDATNSALAITNLASADAGTYQVLVANAAGSTLSAGAIAAVQPGLLLITASLDSGDVQPSIPCQSNDLLQTSLSTVSPAASGNNFTGVYLRNGTTGTAYEGSGGTGSNPASIMAAGTNDFLLDTSAHPDGYDITSIVTYSGWTDARAGQDHSLWVQTVGSAGFSLVTNVSVAASAGALRVAVAETLGPIASGVKAVRIVLNQSYFVYRELDVTGTATAAPPPTLKIALAGESSAVLWWPASATGYSLYSTTNLGQAAAWQSVPATLLKTNGVCQVTLPLTGARFLRLQK
jgi:hypothetical protein